MTPGERLQNLRIKHDLSQKELALLIGYNKTHICKVENGERTISRKMAIQCADFFKVDKEYFLDITPQSNEIATRFLDCRLYFNMTQKEFAEKLDLCVQQISNYETGRVPISKKTLETLHEQLHVSTDWILKGIPPIVEPDETIQIEMYEQAIECLELMDDASLNRILQYINMLKKS